LLICSRLTTYEMGFKAWKTPNYLVCYYVEGFKFWVIFKAQIPDTSGYTFTNSLPFF